MNDYPDLAEYVLSHPCPACLAPPWQPCDIATPDSGPHHRARVDAGIRHQKEDVENDECTIEWPNVEILATEGIGVVEMVDPDTLPSIVDDVSGQTVTGRGLEVRKQVRDGKLINMSIERI